MKNQFLTPFRFENHTVRVQVDEYGNSWFCAKDVCDILGYGNDSAAIKKHCKSDGVTNRYPIADRLGRTQYPSFINEGNMCRLIIKSQMPRAEKFEAWVFDEVLPSIRTTGGYLTPELQAEIDHLRARNAQFSADHLQALQQEVLRCNPRLADVLNLKRIGYSISRIADMLHFGETTIGRDIAKLEACGFSVAAGVPSLTAGGAA